MSLLRLPNELLILVAENLQKRDIKSFCRTSRRLHDLLICLFFDDVDEVALLNWAVETGHETLLHLALYKGASIVAQTPENEFLDEEHWAAIKYDNVLLELRLQANVDKVCVERYEMNALHRATLYGHEIITQVLLDNGAEISTRTSRGDTALHIASCSGHREIASLLLGRGADVNERGWKGCTALHFAAMQGDQDLATIFLGSGADINARNSNQATPLQIAAWRGHVDMVQFLAVMGADINTQDCLGSTPLHLAAANGHEEIVTLLLSGGADKQARDASERTPFGVACANGYRAMGHKLLRTRSNRWNLVDIVLLKAFH